MKKKKVQKAVKHPWYGITYRSIMLKVCRNCGITCRRFIKDVEICVKCAVKYHKATGRKK